MAMSMKRPDALQVSFDPQRHSTPLGASDAIGAAGFTIEHVQSVMDALDESWGEVQWDAQRGLHSNLPALHWARLRVQYGCRRWDHQRVAALKTAGADGGLSDDEFRVACRRAGRAAYEWLRRTGTLDMVKRICVHEAGHAAYARTEGCTASWVITNIESADPWQLGGECFVWPGSPELDPPRLLDQRLYIAGDIAVWRYRGGVWSADAIFHALCRPAGEQCLQLIDPCYEVGRYGNP